MHFGDLCLYIHSFWEGEEVSGAHHLCCHQPAVPFLMDGAAWSFLIFRAAVTFFCDQGLTAAAQSLQKQPGVRYMYVLMQCQTERDMSLTSPLSPSSCTKRQYPLCLQICYLFQVRIQTFLLPSAPAVHIGAFRCQTAFRKLLFPTQGAATLSSITPAGTASAPQVSDLPLNLQH